MGTFANNCYCRWHLPIFTSYLLACPFHNNKGREETSFIILYLTKISFGSAPYQEGGRAWESQSLLVGLDIQALRAPGLAAKALFAVLELCKTGTERPSTGLQLHLCANLLVSTCSASVLLSLTDINFYINSTWVLRLFLY